MNTGDMSYVLPFTAVSAGELKLTGGKGSSLAKLSQAGFAVPRGFVVSAEAYKAFATEAQTILSTVNTFDIKDAARLNQQAEDLKKALETVALPAAVMSAIEATLQDLPEGIRLAVRSSSTLEDLAEAAFAGQHDTFLNVIGVQDVLHKVKLCFISLWGDRAIAYRISHGFDHGQAAMAVVVQEMVDAQSAGVAFSLNPITGNPAQVLINANLGLGESVVSGESDVDQYLVDVSENRILEQTIPSERIVIRSTESGGTTTAAVAGSVPCLNEAQVLQVSELAQRTARFYGAPQDIEWAFDQDGTLRLLQSRSITNIQPYWTRDESAERFPNVVTPLTWDLVEEGFHNSLRYSLGLMGLPVFHGLWFGRCENYVYGNETVVRLYKGIKPDLPANPAEVMQHLPKILNKYAWVIDLPNQWSCGLDRYLMELGRLNGIDLGQLDIAGVWQHAKDINTLCASYFKPNIAISLAHNMLSAVLKQVCTMVVGTEKAEGLYSDLVSSCETRTVVINRRMMMLAEIIRTTPGLLPSLKAENSRIIIEQGKLAPYPSFKAAFEEFISLFGNREIDFDPYHPTWGEVPWIVLDQLRIVAESSERFNLQEELQRRFRLRGTELAFINGLPENFRPLCASLLRLVRTYTELDDLEHFETSRVSPAIRRSLLELGSRLKEIGVVKESADVWFANRDVLDQATKTDSTADWQALRENISANKASYLASKAKTPAWVFGQEEDSEAKHDDGMKGLAGSPGVAEGPVFLLFGPEDFGNFPDGAVLVARTTNPAWTPLFYSAKAIITESGGPLSHGAVTARELGKPAVMAVRNVLATLKNGQRVRVDGAKGIITLLDAA